MNIQNISITAIRVGERRRPVCPYITWDLQQSIQQSGLLHNIGVIQEAPDGYRLVYGAHRLAAVTELEWAEIPARVFPEGTSDEECLLVELQENMTRNELTGAERKAFAAEVGRLILRLRENSTDEDNSTVESQWFVEFCEKSRISAPGGYKWWASFCKDAGLKLTPKQADMATRLYFFRWLDEQKAKDDAEKARKADEADAEKQRKEEERQATQRARAMRQAQEALEGLIRAHDEETVWLEAVIPAFAHLGAEHLNTWTVCAMFAEGAQS